jgi:hypothetical protein
MLTACGSTVVSPAGTSRPDTINATDLAATPSTATASTAALPGNTDPDATQPASSTSNTPTTTAGSTTLSAGEVSDDLGMLTAEQYRQIELDAFRTDYQISGAAVYIPTENAYDVTISVKNNGPIGTTNPAVGITLGTGVPQPNLDGCINEPNIIECNLGSYLETGETITRTFRTPAPPSGTGTITFTATGNTNITDGTDTNPTNNTTTITLMK